MYHAWLQGPLLHSLPPSYISQFNPLSGVWYTGEFIGSRKGVTILRRLSSTCLVNSLKMFHQHAPTSMISGNVFHNCIRLVAFQLLLQLRNYKSLSVPFSSDHPKDQAVLILPQRDVTLRSSFCLLWHVFSSVKRLD